jgi:hypothetical protein
MSLSWYTGMGCTKQNQCSIMFVILKVFYSFKIKSVACCNKSTTIGEEDVMDISTCQYLEYLGSLNFHTDLHDGLYVLNQKATIAATAAEVLTAQEFCCGVKQDKTHYTNLKEPWFCCNGIYASYSSST